MSVFNFTKDQTAASPTCAVVAPSGLDFSALATDQIAALTAFRALTTAQIAGLPIAASTFKPHGRRYRQVNPSFDDVFLDVKRAHHNDL